MLDGAPGDAFFTRLSRELHDRFGIGHPTVQIEVGEASEPSGPGRGGSSTMPHKRNPVGAALILAAALLVLSAFLLLRKEAVH